MTIKTLIKKQGWIRSVETKPCRAITVAIDFLNHGDLDQTEFCINAYNVNELHDLYQQFCKEERIPQNTVQEIIIVAYHMEKPENVTT